MKPWHFFHPLSDTSQGIEIQECLVSDSMGLLLAFIGFYFLICMWFDIDLSTIYFLFSFRFFPLLGTRAAYGSSQARGQIRAVATGLCHSHSNAGSFNHWARPGIEPASSLVGSFPLSHYRNSLFYFFDLRKLRSPTTTLTSQPPNGPWLQVKRQGLMGCIWSSIFIPQAVGSPSSLLCSNHISHAFWKSQSGCSMGVDWSGEE